MIVFVQSVDGEVRKWFKELTPRSITDIEALDDVFLKHWGDEKDLLYYHTEFGNLKRENGESLSDFNKRFNRMYNKIPVEVKPIPTSAKLTYANAFDSDLCLLLTKRRSASLAEMQDAALEVDSNIMVAEKLKGHVDRRRQRGESSSYLDPEIDKMTKMIESLAYEISKLKVEQHPRKGIIAILDAFSRQIWCLVFKECSANAEVRDLPFLISAPCSLSLVWRERPVSPM